jgi:predicted CopG family antitoxin
MTASQWIAIIDLIRTLFERGSEMVELLKRDDISEEEVQKIIDEENEAQKRLKDKISNLNRDSSS